MGDLQNSKTLYSIQMSKDRNDKQGDLSERARDNALGKERKGVSSGWECQFALTLKKASNESFLE